MSLNFDLSKVKERLGDRWNEITTSPDTLNEPEGSQKWHAVTDFLIWSTMALDLNRITEENVDEWCFRLGLLNVVTKHYRPDSFNVIGGIGGFNLNRVDIENHIGLSTNVTGRSRKEWLNRIFAAGSSDSNRVSLIRPGDMLSAAEQVNAAYAAYVAKEAADQK